MSSSARPSTHVVPPVAQQSGGWHISPVVDLLAYHFSWAFILIPLALAGDVHPADYLGVWAFGMSVSFLHRHYTMPYVYLDHAVFSQHVTRFTLFPAILTTGFVGSSFLFIWTAPPQFFIPADAALAAASVMLVAQVGRADRRGHRFAPSTLVVAGAPFVLALIAGMSGMWKAQHDATDAVLLFLVVLVSAVVARDDDRSQTRLGRAGRGVPGVALVATALCGCLSLAAHAPAFNDAPVKGSALVGAVGALAAGWNVWHTLMQKFGILRVYAAKSTVSLDRKTPAWVDRLFLFGSFPFLAAWLGPAQRHVLESQYKSVTQFLIPVADLLAAAQPVLLPLTGALWVASVALFVWHEWRADGLRTWPRLSMALALTLLNGTFFVVAPLKVYAAYGFSHAIEYMVFVQAFLQRRYASPVHGRPPIARLLRRPLLFWSVFSLLIGGTFFVTQFGKHYGFHTGGLRFLDVKISTWFFSFAVWGSMAHFYFDGFLWKVRTPHVRASL